MMELSRAEKFFEGQEIAYMYASMDLHVKVTMKDAKPHPWEGGADYIYKGGISVHNFKGIPSKVEWEYGLVSFSGAGDLGALFHGLSEKADRLYKVLSMGETRSDEEIRDSLVRYLFQIKEQAEGEFLQKKQHDESFLRQDLYNKYIEPHITKETDD